MATRELHPGFQTVQRGIAQQGAKGGGRLGMKRAGAILASRTREASPAAKKKNPRLLRVKNKKKVKGGWAGKL